LYQIAWIPVLILFNAFFVAAEMALVRVRRTRIDQLAEKDNLFAKKVQIYLQDPERFISACQLGITIATLLLGAAGENALAENIGLLLPRLSFSPPTYKQSAASSCPRCLLTLGLKQ
jgi:CBS domain containing-hemolysin-like protein